MAVRAPQGGRRKKHEEELVQLTQLKQMTRQEILEETWANRSFELVEDGDAWIQQGSVDDAGVAESSRRSLANPREVLEFSLSPGLAAVLKAEWLTKIEAMRRLLQYCKEKGMNNPEDEGEIIFKPKLAKLFGVPRARVSKLLGLIGKHLHAGRPHIGVEAAPRRIRPEKKIEAAAPVVTPSPATRKRLPPSGPKPPRAASSTSKEEAVPKPRKRWSRVACPGFGQVPPDEEDDAPLAPVASGRKLGKESRKRPASLAEDADLLDLDAPAPSILFDPMGSYSVGRSSSSRDTVPPTEMESKPRPEKLKASKQPLSGGASEAPVDFATAALEAANRQAAARASAAATVVPAPASSDGLGGAPIEDRPDEEHQGCWADAGIIGPGPTAVERDPPWRRQHTSSPKLTPRLSPKLAPYTHPKGRVVPVNIFAQRERPHEAENDYRSQRSKNIKIKKHKHKDRYDTPDLSACPWSSASEKGQTRSTDVAKRERDKGQDLSACPWSASGTAQTRATEVAKRERDTGHEDTAIAASSHKVKRHRTEVVASPSVPGRAHLWADPVECARNIVPQLSRLGSTSVDVLFRCRPDEAALSFEVVVESVDRTGSGGSSGSALSGSSVPGPGAKFPWRLKSTSLLPCTVTMREAASGELEPHGEASVTGLDPGSAYQFSIQVSGSRSSRGEDAKRTGTSTSQVMARSASVTMPQRARPADWTEQEALQWCLSVKVPELARKAEEYSIDGATLLSLGEEDIRELGVTAPFLVRRILTALKALRNG